MGKGDMRWIVEEKSLSVQSLHSLTVKDWSSPTVWIMSPTDRCVVLGSSQSDQYIDYSYAEREGIGVARRNSGGGAVWVDQEALLWVDLFLPRDHHLWIDDIHVSANWLGGVWHHALGKLGIDCQLHNGSLKRSPIADLICFAGRGPGELLIGNQKILGLSQRRTREGTRFQCALTLEWNPKHLINLFNSAPIKNIESLIRDSGTNIRFQSSKVVDVFLQALDR
jgi:lipoate-protein ligase A